LIGNKFDAVDQREVPTDQGQKLARQLEIPFMEVSARTRVNIDEMFIAIIREIDQRDKVRVARRASTRPTNAAAGAGGAMSPRSRFGTLRKKLNTPSKCIIL
jgi:GTPase SAR1 family protein